MWFDNGVPVMADGAAKWSKRKIERYLKEWRERHEIDKRKLKESTAVLKNLQELLKRA